MRQDVEKSGKAQCQRLFGRLAVAARAVMVSRNVFGTAMYYRYYNPFHRQWTIRHAQEWGKQRVEDEENYRKIKQEYERVCFNLPPTESQSVEE